MSPNTLSLRCGDVLYTRGKGELCFYDGLENFIFTVLCRKGVRQGCVLGTTILCITVKPVYDAILVILGPENFFPAMQMMYTWEGGPRTWLSSWMRRRVYMP
jgi:hypothetical protein